MIDKVEATIKKYNLLEEGDSVTVGLSGGADSVSLLKVLYSLRDKLSLNISAVHVNHMIRGEEADRDEKFVIDFCKGLDIPLTVFHKNIPLEASKSGESEEECGRRIRYECFNSVVCGGKIATAHTLSDSIETMIFNMLRGSSASGLTGIPVRRDNIIRPLIDCTREEIEAFCVKNNLDYVTDSTNLQTEYTRNYIRREILPLFSKVNPSYMASLSRLREFISDDNACLNNEARKLLSRAKTEKGLNVNILCDENISLVRRVLVLYIKESFDISPESRHIKLITENMLKDYTLQLSENICVEIKNGFIFTRLIKQKKSARAYCIPLEIGENEFCDNVVVANTLSRKDFFNNYYKMLENAIDCDKIKGTVLLRSRREGDKIFLRKRKVTKSLHKLFIEMKIPSEKRDCVPVLCDEEKILWVGGVGVNGECCVNEETDKILLLKLK